ncbi:MAG: hypothetical protein U0531_07215 [Dehalococcoidia bacterium]
MKFLFGFILGLAVGFGAAMALSSRGGAADDDLWADDVPPPQESGAPQGATAGA